MNSFVRFIICSAILLSFATAWAEGKKPSSSILIFVSFSMPKQSLEDYLHDAKKIHASVVIRGLIDNSFQKTFKVIGELVKESNGDGVELNPKLFKKFKIESVPAVVVVSPENKEDFDVMTGNIGLSAALYEIENRGKFTRNIAKAALSTLNESSHA